MADKRNLIFICTDQQRTDTMPSYGNDWIQTPHLNGLSDSGFVFENAYVAQAVCTPARATMLTGLYPHSAGAIKNSSPDRPQSGLGPDVKTIAEMVSDDYLCAYFGKWHLGDDLSAQHGFERWISVEDAHEMHSTHLRKEHRFRKSDYFKFLVRNGQEPEGLLGTHTSFTPDQRGRLPEELAIGTFLGDEAATFIREQSSSDRPFILFVSIFEPHPPYNGPLNDLYPAETIPDGPLFLKELADNSPLFNRLRAEHYTRGGADNLGLKSPADWRALRGRYYGNVTLMDRGVGKVLDALEESGQSDDTVVVFTSDHGDSLGDRGMLGKRAFYDEVSKVPLLMRVPWLADRETRVPGSIGHVDLVPTLLELLDQPIPSHLQGESRVPVLRGDATLADNDVFMQWYGEPPTVPLGTPAIELMAGVPWRSVVTGDRWKLNLSPGDQCELFDLTSDPWEETNLFDEPAHRDRVREMTARIRRWQFETEDDLVLPMV